MVSKARRRECSIGGLQDFSAPGNGEPLRLSANAVGEMGADSCQVAMKEWEQVWKQVLSKNENAVIKHA
jgi:hypothetical protein